MSDPTIPQVVPIPNKNIKDITGQRFARLTVIGYVGSVKIGAYDSSYAQWLCACECGARIVAHGANLRSGNTQSCGCLHTENAAKVGKSTRKHGKHDTSEYHVWEGMKDRCGNPNSVSYERYGGRGIKVCDRWRNSFENFFEDMGPRPSPNHSLDRVDNDGNYEPSNCRWATAAEQANNRADTMLVTFNGATRTITEWSRLTGINREKLLQRISRYGWNPGRALTTP